MGLLSGGDVEEMEEGEGDGGVEMEELEEMEVLVFKTPILIRYRIKTQQKQTILKRK